MSEKDNIFDQLIRESVKGYESAYDQSSWTAVQKGINSPKAGAGGSLAKWFIASSLIIGVALIGYFSMSTKESEIEVSTANIETPLLEDAKSDKKTDIVENQNSQAQKNEVGITDSTNTVVQNEVVKEQASSKNKLTPTKKNYSANKKTTVKRGAHESSNNKSLIISDQNIVCERDIVVFKAADSLKNATYLWPFGDGEKAISYKVRHPFKTEGNYEVILQVKLENGEILKSSKNIYVNSKPKANFNFETTDFNCHNSSICFSSDISASYNKLYWNFGDKKYSEDPNPKHTYHKKGHYNVRLRVESSVGCKDSIQKQVYVMRAFNLLATKDFSPNGDGVKDTWIPIALQSNNQKFTINIMNQMGQPVFITNSSNKPWNGELNGGGIAKPGEFYIWIALVEDSIGNLNEYGGSILVTE